MNSAFGRLVDEQAMSQLVLTFNKIVDYGKDRAKFDMHIAAKAYGEPLGAELADQIFAVYAKCARGSPQYVSKAKATGKFRPGKRLDRGRSASPAKRSDHGRSASPVATAAAVAAQPGGRCSSHNAFEPWYVFPTQQTRNSMEEVQGGSFQTMSRVHSDRRCPLSIVPLCNVELSTVTHRLCPLSACTEQTPLQLGSLTGHLPPKTPTKIIFDAIKKKWFQVLKQHVTTVVGALKKLLRMLQEGVVSGLGDDGGWSTSAPGVPPLMGLHLL